MASKREWKKLACALMASALDDPHFLIHQQADEADADRMEAACTELMAEMHRRAGVTHYSELSGFDCDD